MSTDSWPLKKCCTPIPSFSGRVLPEGLGQEHDSDHLCIITLYCPSRYCSYQRQLRVDIGFQRYCDQTNPALFISSNMCLPMRDGDFETTIPAFSKALILLGASPFPFCTIAPACPILRSAGAVRPAIKPTTGFFLVLFFLSHSAAISSFSPPISPMMTMPSVSGSTTNFSKTSMKLVPLKGSPPIPTTVLWPSPALVVWSTASQVRVPDRLTMPIFPGLWIQPGMMPILHSRGLIMPGQLGPMTLVLFWVRRACLTLIISC